MDTDLKRRLVSSAQLDSLLEFMREHPALARGQSRGRRGRLLTLKVWNSCAARLNAMKDGAVKDGKGWSKYWCDWKYRVRRHALEVRVARDSNRAPPEGSTPLSPLEETIMNIIGDSSLDGVVVKRDPLLDEDSNEDREQETIDNGETNSHVCEKKKRVSKRRRVSAVQTTNQGDSDEEEVPGTPPRRARLERTDESDSDDHNTRQFLRIEEMQLENAKKIQESVSQISVDISKLTDIMGEIRDVLVKRLDNVT